MTTSGFQGAPPLEVYGPFFEDPSFAMTLLVFVRRAMPGVPMWQVIIPVAAVIVLGYTLYRNVYPYPVGDGRWFPIVAGAWLLAAVVGVVCAPKTTRRLGEAMAAREGIIIPHDPHGLPGDGMTAPGPLESSG